MGDFYDRESSFQDTTAARETLLEHGHTASDFSEKHLDREPTRWYRSRPAIIHSFLIILYTSIFLIALWHVSREAGHGPDLIYSPARSAVQYEAHTFHGALNVSNPLKGPASPEVDLAWHNLLEPSNLRISSDTLKRINKTSLALADGSGYLGILDVFHQLHCIKHIRHYIQPDYYPNHDPAPFQHVDHCLDNLRQYVMCHADISIMTFSWLPNFQRPWPDFDVTHECRNWDVVNEWAKGHSIDFFDEKVIKHPGYDPSLGNPWTDGGVASENAS